MLGIILLLMACHFVADFPLQPPSIGRRKSEKLGVLLLHIGIHFVVFALALILPMGLIPALLFSLGNALIHGLIDWNIWRGYKWWVKRRIEKGTAGDLLPPGALPADFKFWNDHSFFITIGFDQLLHGATLLLILSLLSLV